MRNGSPSRIDVLLILGAFQLRGSYTRALTLAEHLPADRVRARLLATDQVRVRPERLKQLEVRVARHANWPGLGRLSRWILQAEYAAAMPDLLDIQHRKMHDVGVWLARRLRRPYVLTIHDYLGDRDELRIDLRWCRGIVAVSDSVRTELLARTRTPEDLVTVVPSGVVPPPAEQLHPVLVSEQAPVVGTAGPLEAGKGLIHFLKAAAEIRRFRPDALFLIAGSGPEEKSLRRLASQLKLTESLTILPNLNDFGPALRAMDLFVLPSLKQGLGTIMLEAMARALPVVGTESGGVHSVVTDGLTGLLVPPSDEAALAAAVVRLLDDPDQARQLGQTARTHVLERFHVSAMTQAVLSLYERAIAAEEPSQQMQQV